MEKMLIKALKEIHSNPARAEEIAEAVLTEYSLSKAGTSLVDFRGSELLRKVYLLLRSHSGAEMETAVAKQLWEDLSRIMPAVDAAAPPSREAALPERVTWMVASEFQNINSWKGYWTKTKIVRFTDKISFLISKKFDAFLEAIEVNETHRVTPIETFKVDKFERSGCGAIEECIKNADNENYREE